MSFSGWVHLDVERIMRATDKALLLRLKGGAQVWMPRAQIADDDDYSEGDRNCTVSVTEWIAEQKGLA